MRADRYNNNNNKIHTKNPSFSSSLLDEIYRSISENDVKHEDLKFYRDPMPKNQIKSSKFVQKDRRDCLIDKWIDKKVGRKIASNGKSRHVFEEDPVFFSSTSISSDSSSGGFSFSDSDSFSGTKSKPKPKSKSAVSVSAPVPPIRPKPVKTRPENTEKAAETPKSKSRAMKIYNNLKNIKQPISPGGKLSNFINSIFTKSRHPSSSIDEERKFKSTQASTCSSASSFSRSCLSKPEKFRAAGVKRTVRFYSDEDRRPCGEKSDLMPVSLPTAWKIGKSPTKKTDSEFKYEVMDKSRRVEEVARDFLREYQKRNVNDLIDEDEDDAAASDSSSDLFELDNLALIGKDREFIEELPVYETTYLSTNCAIANGLRF